MRKLLCLIAAAVLLGLSAWTCYAAEETQNRPGSETVGVFVDAEHTPVPGVLEAPAVEGAYTVETPEGVRITVRPEAAREGLRLVVYPVLPADQEAYRWFSAATGDFGTGRRYYDMYFLDAAGNRVEGGPCQVTLTLPAGYTAPKMAMLGRDGHLTALPHRLVAGGLEFTMPGNGYYVLAEKVGGTPPGGDRGLVWLWTGLLALSGMGLAAAVLLSNEKARPC